MRRNLIAISILIFITQILNANTNTINKKISRSIATEALGSDANATAFAGPNQFYIATNANTDKSLSRIAMTRAEDGSWKAVYMPMAPSTNDVIINQQTDQTSPLNAKDITHLIIGSDTAAYKRPVVGLIEGQDPDQKVLLFQVIDTNEGKVLLKTSSMDNATEYPIKDATATNAKALHALAATLNLEKTQSAPFIFALVSDNTNLTDATAESIGVVPVVRATYVGLNPLDATNFNNSGINNKAAGIINALKITTEPTFLQDATVDMYWDDNLQRLFIANSNLQTTGGDTDGAIGLLIGSITSQTDRTLATDSLQIQKCANISDENWPAGNSNKNWIVGYKNDTTVTDTKEQIINLHKVRVMHTSTGRDYVIVNGEVAQDINSTMCSVYALPVMPNSSPDAGKLAKINSETGVFETITNGSELFRNTDAKIIVGTSPKYLVHGGTADAYPDAKITDMQIFGDTVYISVAGSRGLAGTDTAGEAGIFASTAIFDSNRVIRAWTPWQRVMGNTDKVFGFGFDTGTNNFWYIGPDQQTGKITIWSSGDIAETGIHEGSPLNSALKSFFQEDKLGVVNLTNFDDETSGFKTWNPESAYPAFSMMVGTGLGNVALIEAGKRESLTNNKSAFIPTKKFEAKLVSSTTDAPTATTNIFVFNDAVTQALGFITCAEVSRIKTSITQSSARSKQLNNVSNGWLFIGGQNGLGVLCKTGGTGWDTSKGLAHLSKDDFPGSGYSFLKLTPPSTNYDFSNIRKLVSDGTYLYILTHSDLYRLEMNAHDFTNYTTIDSSRLKVIAKIDGEFKDDSDTQITNKYLDEFFDIVLIDNTDNAKKLAIATTQGVWISNAISDNFDSTNIKWNKNISRTGEKEIYLGPSLKLDFLPIKRGGNSVNDAGSNTINGNLYVTTIDYKFKDLVVCRFNVANGSLKLFDEPYNDQGLNTPYFYKLADLGDIFRSTQFGDLDHVGRNDQLSESIDVIPDPNNFISTDLDGSPYYAAINLGMDPQTALHLFSIIRDTASGALYIPGEFNVFVNE